MKLYLVTAALVLRMATVQAQTTTQLDAQIQDARLVAAQRETAVALRQEAKAQSQAYWQAVNTGPEVADANATIAQVSRDLQTARLARVEKQKAARAAGDAAPDLTTLEDDIAQLQAELLKLVQQRRQVVRANRQEQVGRKAQVDAAEEAYRTEVNSDAQVQALRQQKADVAAMEKSKPVESTD